MASSTIKIEADGVIKTVDTSNNLYKDTQIGFNPNLYYTGFADNNEIADQYKINKGEGENNFFQFCQATDPWNESKELNYKYTDGDGVIQNIKTIVPGTRPTFRSQATVRKHDVEVNLYGKKRYLPCLACRSFTTADTGDSIEVAMYRRADDIVFKNLFYASWFNTDSDFEKPNTKGYGKITDYYLTDPKNLSTSNLGNGTWTTPDYISGNILFQDKTLPRRLLILLQGSGGGGGGGNNGTNDSSGGGGGSGAYWFGVVRFDESDVIKITLGNGGSGGETEKNGSKGQDTVLYYNGIPLIQLTGGEGGAGVDGGDDDTGKGGDGGTVKILNTYVNNKKVLWTISSADGKDGGYGILTKQSVPKKYADSFFGWIKLYCCSDTARSQVAEIEGITYIKVGNTLKGKTVRGGGGAGSLLGPGGSGGDKGESGVDGYKGSGGGGGGESKHWSSGKGGGHGGDACVFIWG